MEILCFAFNYFFQRTKWKTTEGYVWVNFFLTVTHFSNWLGTVNATTSISQWRNLGPIFRGGGHHYFLVRVMSILYHFVSCSLKWGTIFFQNSEGGGGRWGGRARHRPQPGARTPPSPSHSYATVISCPLSTEAKLSVFFVNTLKYTQLVILHLPK